ncbi:MAG: hypothetical protein U9Q79_00730 [Candidatus Hydrogenedentes bacterium]|nr:hypothetical protein [Candidatus Hydrogenedentota bacterium]
MQKVFVVSVVLITASAVSLGADESWRLPLAEKERILEANIQERHNILGLYPSQVEVPLDGSPVDQTTRGISNIAHSVCWTANYLAGASYRYAFLKKSGAPADEVAAAKKRVDEIFEAVYRCQLVTGRRGLQARGYAIGHGPSYEEREDAGTRNEWHQGVGEYKDLRWRGDPSHHNYSDAIHGLGQYYDLAAEGEMKDRCREAIDALVGYWADNDLLIYKLDKSRQPTILLGFTDNKTLDTRVMMAIAGAKVAHHATGDPKYLEIYNRLIEQYGVRGLKEFKTEKGFDDAEHVFCHLENLFRIEKDPELLDAYRRVLDGLWANHKNDAQSLFTYIYMSLTPDAPDREEALDEALFSLQSWPTDMTLKPRMNNLFPDRKPPYPVYQAAWDNEYIWKSHLLRADGWLSRIVTDVAVPMDDPMVIYAIDTEGSVFQSFDGAATPAGWEPVDETLPSPARAIAAGHKSRFVYAACDGGFYMTSTGGHTWEPMPVPEDGGRAADVLVDPANPHIIYATTTRGAYRGLDFGEEFIGKSWESLTDDLPATASGTFLIAPGEPGRIYALIGHTLLTRRLDQDMWEEGGGFGIPEAGSNYPWLVVDPGNPDRLLFGIWTEYGGFGRISVLQESLDTGKTWRNDMRDLYERYGKGGMEALMGITLPGELSAPAIDPGNPDLVFFGRKGSVMKSTDGGKTFEHKKEGLDIPYAETVFAPRNTDWVFAGTPGGLYVSKDKGETWQDANLWLQFIKNTRREIGGAAFIDAYWRARYYGFIDDDTANAPYEKSSANK